MRRVAMMGVLVLGCLSAPTPAAAQASAPSAALDSCVDAAGASRAALEGCKGAAAEPCIEQPDGETTAGLLRCYGAEALAWTAVLDGALARAMEDERRVAALGAAQEAWRLWRDAECRYQASLYEGGSLAPVLAGACNADLIADRAIALLYAERTQEQ